MVLVPQWLRPGVPRSIGNHEARIRALERKGPRTRTGSAYAYFSGAEMAAGVSKVLVAGTPNTIIIPLDFYVVSSADYTPSDGQPTMVLDTPTWGWDSYNVDSFGQTYYNTATVFTSAPGVDSVPLSIAGDLLRATSAPNGATSALGHVEVFVRYYLVTVTP